MSGSSNEALSENLVSLKSVRESLTQIKEQRKVMKTQSDVLQQQAIRAMMNLGVRYVDESGTGKGPFWTVCKDKSDGSFSKDRYMEFFAALLDKLRTDQAFRNAVTPQVCTEMAMTYLKQFQKRRLILTPLSQCRHGGVEELRQWLNNES